MRDREVHWIPDETAAARPLRGRAIGAAVLAISCVVIGIVIGRLTVGIPATGSRPPEVAGMASGKRPELTAPKLSTPPAMQAKPTSNPPNVILLNPGTADKQPGAAPEEARARVQPARERAFREPPENRGRQATEDRRDMFPPPARDYQSLRDYTLSR